MSPQQIITALEKEVGTPLGLLNESHLLDILKDSIFPSLVKSLDYSRWDATSNKGQTAIELKCRKKHYSTLRLEKSKYDQMFQHEKQYYINSTPSGIFVFSLSQIKPVWETTLNPKTTEFKCHDMVSKITYDIPILPHNDLTKVILEKLTGKKINPSIKPQPIF